MPRILPLKPNLRYLQEEAKDLLKSHRRGDVAACATLRLHHRFRDASDEHILSEGVSLQEVQHALALDYGFKSWRDLTLRVRQVPAVVDVTSEFRKTGNKGAPKIATAAISDDATLDAVFAAVSSREKKVKNASTLALRIISEKSPERVYPRIDVFAKLLEGDDNILKWIAADVLGNLAAVDVAKKLDEPLVATLLRLAADKTMITAAHAVEALGAVAASKPQFREKITSALLEVDAAERHSECRNILIGKAIEALGRVIGQISDPQPVVEFVRRHSTNSRNSTRKRAEKFLRDLRKGSHRPA